MSLAPSFLTPSSAPVPMADFTHQERGHCVPRHGLDGNLMRPRLRPRCCANRWRGSWRATAASFADERPHAEEPHAWQDWNSGPISRAKWWKVLRP